MTDRDARMMLLEALEEERGEQIDAQQPNQDATTGQPVAVRAAEIED